MEEEIWKDYKGYEGIYRVSNLGNIMRMPRTVVDSIGRVRKFSGHILRKYSGVHGYEYVTLSKDGVERSEFVQRMVALMFVENDDPKHKIEVNHIDENKKNNRADNLEWVTRSENARHGTCIKRMIDTRNRKNSYGSEKRVGKFSLSGTIIAKYDSATIAARENNTNVSNICACCRGVRNNHKGFVWKYI